MNAFDTFLTLRIVFAVGYYSLSVEASGAIISTINPRSSLL